MQRPSIAMQRIQFGLHYTALHCTALHCTALHCTALHCTARVLTWNVLLHDDWLLRLYFAPTHGRSDPEG
jgi:hypothetical protein